MAAFEMPDIALARPLPVSLPTAETRAGFKTTKDRPGIEQTTIGVSLACDASWVRAAKRC